MRGQTGGCITFGLVVLTDKSSKQKYTLEAPLKPKLLAIANIYPLIDGMNTIMKHSTENH